MSLNLSPAEVYLNAHRLAFTKTDDGMIVVAGNLSLSRKELTTLPDLSNVIVKGDFFCNYNRLQNLRGMPHTVEGSVYCDNNDLTSLAGAARHIGKSFFCHDNLLSTLEDGPETVGEDYSCQGNKLVILKGAPKSVGRSFYCNINRLTTMEGCPTSVPDTLLCKDNPLEDLYGIATDFQKLKSPFGEFYEAAAIPAVLLTCSSRMARIEQGLADARALMLKNAVDKGSSVSAPVPLMRKISLKPRK